MKAIYASKLYRASSRKDKIKAAIANPLNAELVTQLRSYLDDEYQDLATSKKVHPVEFDKPGDTETTESSQGEPQSSSSSSPVPSHSGGSLSAQFDKLLGDEADTNEETANSFEEPSAGSEPDVSDESGLEDIGESTDILGDIKSIDVAAEVENIKQMLSSDNSTQGVNRALFKEANNELWIYYNDSVNLNNVMGPVIEKINSAGYDYLDFNRLARSENAIVFQVNTPVVSVTDEEDIDDED